MRIRIASISVAFFFSSVFALAQSPGWQPPVPGPARVNHLPPMMASQPSYLTGACPVGLRAQRRATVTMVTIDGKLQRETVPSVRLAVNNLQGKDIVGATVRVRGYSARPQLFLVSGVSSAREMTKMVALKLDVAQGKNGETEVTAEKFGSISRIDLEALDYADGSEWHASVAQPCSVEPDLLVLVADR
jgi:hypothetical protein